jgi:hypothetical protein
LRDAGVWGGALVPHPVTNEYIQWRYAVGEDREALQKVGARR